MSQFGENDKSMLHAFCEGQSRVVDGKMELLLKDGTWYPIQERMEDVDQAQNGTKWFAFNCPREEPRFAGLTYSGLAMKKKKTTKVNPGV